MRLKYKSGKTPLRKINSLGKRYNVQNIFIKDESKNPFGTFKDRVSEFIINKAVNERVDKLVLITAGNAGYSLSQFAKGTRIKVICVIDKTVEAAAKQKLRTTAYKVIEVNLSKGILKPEQVISLARENDTEVIWDVTNGYHEAYESIIKEIKGKKPDYIVVPVGSGGAFVGLYNGIKKYNLKTKLIGIGVKEKYHSFADKLWTPWTPYQSKIKAIVKMGHKYIELSEGEVKRAYEGFKDIVPCEPSSTVVFAVFSKLTFNKYNRIILINSGMGIL